MRIVASLVLAAAILSSSQVASATLITPDTDPFNRFEGDPGAVGFTLTNDLSVPLTVTSISTSLIENQNRFERDDKVASSSIANDRCTGFMIPSAGTCRFTLNFTTADTSGTNDNDVGTWRLSVRSIGTITIGGQQDSDLGTGNVIVNVLDPIPEPGSAMLFGVGIFAMLAYRLRQCAVGEAIRS